ncbi:DUF533 domain-containing protein [Tropicimonas sp. S265A]|uniref:DUF533 domain-containing protein n=1 Tax=Tropicimonas sp. S265A TaxID=3415134 RepID=UPI003C7E9C0E
MSFLKAMATMAVGYAAARGVDKLSGGEGLGALMQGGAGGAGGLQDMLGQLTGGGADGAGGGLQDMLGQLTGGSADGASGGGGLQDMLGQLTGGAQGEGGGGTLGLAGIVGALGLAGGATAASSSLGDILSGHIDDGAPSPEAEANAKLLLRTMIEAAKSDGGIDMEEKQRILDTIGDAGPGEVAYVTQQMQAPLDPQGLAAETPRDMAEQVYTTALMTIKLDNQAEAQFLHTLGQSLGMQEAQMDDLHRRMGAPTLYS